MRDLGQDQFIWDEIIKIKLGFGARWVAIKKQFSIANATSGSNSFLQCNDLRNQMKEKQVDVCVLTG